MPVPLRVPLHHPGGSRRSQGVRRHDRSVGSTGGNEMGKVLEEAFKQALKVFTGKNIAKAAEQVIKTASKVKR